MNFLPFSLNNAILASAIPLHAQEIHYLAYEGDYAAVGDLRRKLVGEEEDDRSDLLSATFLTIQVISQSLHRLWLFSIGIRELWSDFDDRLAKVAESTIVLRNLYPCSEECSHQNTPCSNCSSSSNSHLAPTTSKHLPRRPWRRPWGAFLDAVRATLLRRVNRTTLDSDAGRWACALKNGFIISNSTMPSTSDEWVTSGWEQARPLLYVHFQVQPALDPSPRLIVHPTITRTQYFTLDSAPVVGAAVTLLPYATPAYFVASYSGPTSALTVQFQTALQGLGVDGWEGAGWTKKSGKGRSALGQTNYAIFYIRVQGPSSRERKGLTVIYPARLALALPPSVRSPLNPWLLPVLPAPLQPSPMVPAAVVNPVLPANGTINSPVGGPRSAYQFPSSASANTFPTLNSPLGYGYTHPWSASAPGQGAPFPLPPPGYFSASSVAGTLSTHIVSHVTLPPSLSNAALLRAHRVLSTASRLSALSAPSAATSPAAVPTPGAPTPGTVGAPTPGGHSNQSSTSKNNPILVPGSTTSSLNLTATEISAYVDHVHKERERERERLREAHRGRTISGQSSSTLASTPANPGNTSGARSVPPISIPNVSGPSNPAVHPSHPTHSGPGPGPGTTDAQMFYPSPPTNPPSVSAAGVGTAMSPGVGNGFVPGPPLLPQIPQGLPSMHDATVDFKRVPPPPPPPPPSVMGTDEGAMDVSMTSANDNGRTGVSLDAYLSARGNEPTHPALENANDPLLPPVTVPPAEPVPPSVPAPAPEVAVPPSTNSTASADWGNYFGSDGMSMDLDRFMNDINMNMNGGTSGLGGDNMDMDMALFGVDSGSSLNLDDLGWNMGSAFGFESGLGSAVAATAITGGSELGPLALQSANAFAQPIPPPMTRSVTAPTTVPQTAVSTHHSSGSGSGSGLGIGAMDFEDITDDDFSFFDNKPTMPTNQSESSSVPSAAPMIVLSQPSASAPPAINSSGTPSNTTGLSDSLAFLNNEESFFQSLGLPPPLPIGSAPTPYPSHSTPGRGGITASGFTPLTVDIEVEMEMDPGLPSPPAEDGDRTNPSKDVIKVQLDDNTDSPPPSLSSPLHPEPVRPGFSRLAGAGSSMPLMPLRDKKFSAIPFAKSHLVADSKYRVSGGKFALLRSSSGWIHNHKLSPRPRSIASGDREGKLQPSPTLKEQETNINKAELARGAWALPSPPVDSDDAESSSDDSTSGDEDDDLPLAVVTGITPRLPLPVTSSAEDSPVQLRSGTKNLTPQPSTRQAPRRHRGWRPKYDRATDPRIGVVKKLARQKIRSALATRDRRPRWIRDWENETGRRVDEAGSVQIEEEDSEMDDDDDDDDDEGSAVEQDQLGHMDDESHQLEKTSRRDRSRPTTPLPGYLPPGPDLIATCFHWVHLDGISEGERTASNEDMMVQELHQTAHPQYDGILHGVPTPISPSAYMGGSTSASPAFVVTPGPSWNQSSPADTDPMKEGEKSRLTEANVFTIARECAENYVWADAWTTVDELVGDSGTTEYFKNDRSHPMNMQSYMEMSLECVGPNDVAAVKQLLAGTFSDTLLRVEDLFDGAPPKTTQNQSSNTAPSSNLLPLSPPLLTVAKSGAAIDVLPSALHFWDKLGLDPKSGKKNTTVLVVHDKNYLESDSMMDGSLGAARSWRFEQIQLWLKNVTELYKVKHYGEMTLGKSDSCDADGIASFKFDSSFEKNLASLIADFATPNGSLMFFVLVPLSSMTFTSESLRCLLSGVQRNHETYHEVQILFQFVPEPHVLNSPIHPSSPHDFRTASFLESVYNRILLPIDRAMSRPLFSYDGARVKNFFEAPSFTLARSLSDSKVKYSSAVNPPLDILDHHTLLHVGYQLSSCGRWILAACIDQRGEAHDIGVWSTQPYLSVDNKNEDATLDTTPVSDEMYMVGKVWDFGIQFAEKASVEWRIVFTKLGTVGSAELNAWMAHFSTALYSIAKNARTPVHASLLSVEHSTPWMFLPPTSQSALPSSKGPSLSRSTSGSNKTSTKSQIFIDTSMTAYNIFHKALIPTTPPPTLQDVGLASDFVINSATLIDHDDHSLADGQSVLPLSSSALLQTPPSSSHSLARHQMINIHLLYAAKSEGCSYPTITAGAADSPQSLLRDITDSFYSLAVLSNVKSTAVDGKTSLLPFHLSAVKTMRNALSVRGGADCV